jgi:hypothetical protein
MSQHPPIFGDFKFVIAELIKRSGMNPTQFARKLGYANSGALFMMLQGKKSPPLDQLDNWFDILGLEGAERKRLWLRALEEFAPPYVLRLVNQFRFEWRTFAADVAREMKNKGLTPPPLPDPFEEGDPPPRPARRAR